MEEMKNKSATSQLSVTKDKRTDELNGEAHSSHDNNGDESDKADSDICQIDTGKRVQEQDKEGGCKDPVDHVEDRAYDQRQLKKTMRQRGGKLIEQLFSQTNKRTVHLLEQQTEEFFKLSNEFKNRLAAGTSALPDVSGHAASMMPKFSRAQLVNFLKTSRVPIFAGDTRGNSDVHGSQIHQSRAQHLDSLLRGGTPSGSLMQARASIIASRPETDQKLAERCSSGSIIQRSQLIDFLRSSDDETVRSTSSIPHWQRVCRICYFGGAEDEGQESSNVTQKCSLTSSAVSSNSSRHLNVSRQNDLQRTDSDPQSSTKKERLLTRICLCKGSLSFVHESCLLKWIDQCSSTGGAQGGKRCEICLQEYIITYEFDSASNIVRNGMNYAFGDMKRLIRGLLYALYLWIFYRRFLHMIKSAFGFAVMSWIRLIQHMLYGQRIAASKPVNEVRLRLFSRVRASMSIKRLVGLLIQTVGVLYRVFIFVQMCLLGIGESMRLKKYAHFLIANAKKRTVKRLSDAV